MSLPKPYPFQKRVADTLLNEKSVVLQAPTGAGKTRASLLPFMHAQRPETSIKFPAQCIYSVPRRVLANQFFAEYHQISDSFGRRFRSPLEVRLQTGEFPDDPKLEGDLIFATLDQTLSSALAVPYSLSRSQANLNVAAVLGSYLVFDEFHLFPRQAAKATLQLLRAIGRVAPFVLMTATFSSTMLEEIGDLLGAKLIVVPDEEVSQIETHWGAQPRKQRHFRVVERPLGAAYILEAHEYRSLAVCNTVDRATALFDDLLAQGCRPVPFEGLVPERLYQNLRAARKPEQRQTMMAKALSLLQECLFEATSDKPWAMLLHSRFERPHRQVKEELLQALWGPGGPKGGNQASLVVVATQVVEVGLDISSQALHTELAPAASVLQRSGRCARVPGESGVVHVYQVPPDKNTNPNYAPYTSKVEKAICERTWAALRAHHDTVLHFEQEQEVIDAAHTKADRKTLNEMEEDKGRIWRLIADALSAHDASTRRDLIRDNIESRTLLVFDAPAGLSEESPYRLEGFSLWQGTLHGKLKDLHQLQTELELDWALRYPVAIEDEQDEGAPAAYQWLTMDLEDAKVAREEIGSALIFAINPYLIIYDAERGFRLAKTGDGSYRSPEALARRKPPDYGGYRLESYDEHVTRMRQVFERGPWQRRLAWVAHRLVRQRDDWQLPAGLLGRAVRLAFALHHVGKLDDRWQKWAARIFWSLTPITRGGILTTRPPKSG